MSLAEYSLIFISILVGYIVTVTMVGWGKLIKHFEANKFSLLYLLWSLSMFLYLLFIWFWTYKGFKNNFDFLEDPAALHFIILRLLIIYFAIETLTPEEKSDYHFKNHFQAVARKFYFILLILWLYELLLYPVTGHAANLLSFNLRVVLYLISLPIAILLLVIKNSKIKGALAIVNLICIILANILELEIL